VCRAFIVDGGPWKSDHNLLAIPISLFLWLLINIGLWGVEAIFSIPVASSNHVLGDPISQTILALAIYGLVVLSFRWRVSSRQIAAFQIIRQMCARADPIGPKTLEVARQSLHATGAGSFNTLIAYNRLRLLLQAEQAGSDARDGVVEAVRQHADTDWESLDSSLSTTQFLIWLLPTVGFLGTVYGMTQALKSFSAVVGSTNTDLSFTAGLTATAEGLGIAFHTTLVGLATVIPLLAVATALRRRSQSLLERLDTYFLQLATYTLYHVGETESAPVDAGPPAPAVPQSVAVEVGPPAPAVPQNVDVEATPAPAPAPQPEFPAVIDTLPPSVLKFAGASQPTAVDSVPDAASVPATETPAQTTRDESDENNRSPT